MSKQLRRHLVLGGKEKSTLKEISELLGKETIDSPEPVREPGPDLHGLNYQKLGRGLMTQDEIAVMDGGKLILQLRGVRPFSATKYDLTKHPRYKYRNRRRQRRNVFGVERYMKRRPAIVKPDEPFDMYELSAKKTEQRTQQQFYKTKKYDLWGSSTVPSAYYRPVIALGRPLRVGQHQPSGRGCQDNPQPNRRASNGLSRAGGVALIERDRSPLTIRPAWLSSGP